MPEKYKVTIEVTDRELQDSQYGSVTDLSKIVDKVIAEAKKQGFKEER